MSSDIQDATGLAMLRRLAPLYLGIVVGPLNTSGAFNLIPIFSDDFAVSIAVASLSVTLYMVPFVATQVFSSVIAEVFGPARALVIGFAIFSASSLLAAVTPTLETFLLTRMLQGLGGGIILPVGMAMAASQVPPHRTATAIGGVQGAFAIGLALGPGVAGIFAEQIDWRGFFVFLSGAGLLAAFLIGIAYPMRREGRPAGRNPLAPLGTAIRIGGVRTVSVVGLLLSFASVGVTIFLAVWLQRDSGLTGPAGAGVLLSIPGLIGIAAAPLAGYLGDHWGIRKTFVAGVVVAGIGIAGIFAVPGILVGYLAWMVLLGIGNTATTTNFSALSLVLWPQLRQAVAGLFNGARFFGLAAAPLILAPLYDSASIRGVLIVAIALLLVCAVALRAVPQASSSSSS